MIVLQYLLFTILPFRSIYQIVEKANLSTFDLKEHKFSVNNFGNISVLLSTKYTVYIYYEPINQELSQDVHSNSHQLYALQFINYHSKVICNEGHHQYPYNLVDQYLQHQFLSNLLDIKAIYQEL